jgi:Flp pilus assembly protein TadG
MRTRFGRGSLPIRTPGADEAEGRCERSEQMAKSMTTRRKAEAGQSLIYLALAMVALLGIMGLGIDFGYLRYAKRQLQMAADVGAVAGALEVPACASSPDCTTMQTAVTNALSENGFSGATVNTGECPPSSVTSLQVYVNNPPQNCMGALAPSGSASPNQYVEVLVAQKEPLFFASVIPGVTQPTIATRSEALTGSGSDCMYALDPSSGGAISLVFGALDSACGIVDESSSGSAFSCFIGFIDAPYTGIVGSDSGLCFFTGASPTTHISDPTPTDPLQYLQSSLESGAPGTGSGNCGTATGNLSSGTYTGSKGPITITGTVTLKPGTYCGGITVNPGANLTFNSGIYSLTSTSSSNGGLTINAGTTVSGNGVGFYNYGPHGGVNFICSSCSVGSDVLTAPNATNCASCSAAWQGILFYQDPGDTASSTVVGSLSYNTKPTGTSYFPDASVTYAFDISVTYNILVAKDITIGASWDQNTTKTYNNYGELTNGSPIKAGAVTVQ